MSSWKLQYSATRIFSPVSFWVHQIVEKEKYWYDDGTTYEPPFPGKIPLKGYPILSVHVCRFTFIFSSMAELEHVISVLSQKNMPSTYELCRTHPRGIGPNSHWLSRLPAYLKSWKKREKIVKALNVARESVIKAGVSF